MRRRLIILLLALGVLGTVNPGAVFVPSEFQMPGTQPPLQMPEDVEDCGACHGGFDLEKDPHATANGSMMSHSGRDPLFWGQLAVAEQDYPGAGNFCIRCHIPVGWLTGRGLPTDGSALKDSDADGVKCVLCHRLTNPDDSEFVGMQSAPYVANDGGDPAEGYYGAGMLSIWEGFEKLGPYAKSDVQCAHEHDQSRYHRSSDLCGSCHDVSNPAIGDLAPSNGAQFPLAPGSFDGTPGGDVEGKAAFNNFPFSYGIVERTYSEHQASAFADMRVSEYPNLPVDLRRGALEEAYKAALIAGQGGDYADGTPRTFSCQTCHMRPTRSPGCVLPLVDEQTDLPVHDMTGGNYWVPDAIVWLDDRDRLRLGGGLDENERRALAAGKQRALHNLRQAAALEVDVDNDRLRVINLTGHKLISGYPEGRRMWLNIVWYDAQEEVVREDGAYGTLDVEIDGEPAQVESLLDLDDPRGKVYRVENAISRDWAVRMIELGFPSDLILSYDRITGLPDFTLAELAALGPDAHHETFHFILNDQVISDNRIPPYGMDRSEAERRNALPVPATQYGNPDPGEVFEYWDVVDLDPPEEAVRAEIRLLYQTTSWEYVQFVRNQNDGSNAFLATVGDDLLDSWLATGMSAPQEMASARWVRP